MSFIFEIILGKPIWMWATFVAIIIGLLILDLGVFQKKTHEISLKESLTFSLVYIVLSSIYGAWVWYYLGATSGKEYFTGYLVEKTLSIDNVFVMSLIFSFFHIPRMYQHRVLFWGILGVLVLRGIMIGVGDTLISEFSWILYIFAAFLVFSGIKMLMAKDSEPDIANNSVLKLIRKLFRVTPKLHGNKFLVKQIDPATNKQIIWITPLLVALVLIEIADVIFAVDSVPAIFSITQDPFVVYTSNIFAVLGLRALYFALAAILHRFQYLKPALAFVLIFIGSKIFVAHILGVEKIPASISLGGTLSLILGGIIVSLYKTRKI